MSQPRTAGMKVQYADTLDCAKKVVQYEGMKGLYRGISLQLAYVATGDNSQKVMLSSTIPHFLRESHQAGHQRLHQRQTDNFWSWTCVCAR